MQSHRRDGSVSTSFMVQRRQQQQQVLSQQAQLPRDNNLTIDIDNNMVTESYHRSGKNRGIGARYSFIISHLTNLSLPFSIFMLVVLLVFALWDVPPFVSARHSLCSFSTPPAYRSANNDILLDRFADSASDRLRRKEWQPLTTLVLVAGHAIFLGKQWTTEQLNDEANWILESFQNGQVKTFLKHIEKGVQLTVNDSTALLLFSGGQTREGAGPRSEGLTYWMAAEAQDWYGYKQSGVSNRSLSEEYARDSFENLLFSVCRFRQVVGRYPRVIKVVGFEFKRIRFVDIHRKALRFPYHRFQYYGVDPDIEDGMRGMSAGERARAMGPFAGDPYGCNTPVLSGKRESRDPYLRYHPYPQGCPELAGLFRYCGRSIFSGPLPWDPQIKQQEKKI